MKRPKMPYFKRTHINMGVSKDEGLTWQQELVNVRECRPNYTQLKVGDQIWWVNRRFVVYLHDDGRIQLRMVEDRSTEVEI